MASPTLTGAEVLVYIVYFCVALTISTGINSIPEKLADMCPKFEMWDSWFGTSQKYAPSSIVQSSLPESDVDDAIGESDVVNEEPGAAADGEHAAVNHFDGGLDGRQDDAATAAGAAATAAQAADQGIVIVESDNVHGPSSAAPSVAPAPSHSSPSGMPSPPVVGGRGRGRGRGESTSALRTVTANLVEQKALLAQAVMGRPLVTSPSQSGSSGSGKSTFDAVYAEAAKKKCAVMLEVSSQRSATETRHQQSEHSFKREERCAQQEFQKEMELQKQSLEHKFLQQQQAVNLLAQRQETKVRKEIEYDKTLASLLIADKTGTLADDFETRRKREREASGHETDPVSSFLMQFMPRDRDRH